MKFSPGIFRGELYADIGKGAKGGLFQNPDSFQFPVKVYWSRKTVK
jgi:hypothetical protein